MRPPFWEQAQEKMTRRKGWNSACTCSCLQQQGSASQLCDCKLNASKWLLERVNDMSNKGLYLGFCFQTGCLNSQQQKWLILSEAVSNQKKFKFVQKHNVNVPHANSDERLSNDNVSSLALWLKYWMFVETYCHFNFWTIQGSNEQLPWCILASI